MAPEEAVKNQTNCLKWCHLSQHQLGLKSTSLEIQNLMVWSQTPSELTRPLWLLLFSSWGRRLEPTLPAATKSESPTGPSVVELHCGLFRIKALARKNNAWNKKWWCLVSSATWRKCCQLMFLQTTNTYVRVSYRHRHNRHSYKICHITVTTVRDCVHSFKPETAE